LSFFPPVTGSTCVVGDHFPLTPNRCLINFGSSNFFFAPPLLPRTLRTHVKIIAPLVPNFLFRFFCVPTIFAVQPTFSLSAFVVLRGGVHHFWGFLCKNIFFCQSLWEVPRWLFSDRFFFAQSRHAAWIESPSFAVSPSNPPPPPPFRAEPFL